MKLLIKSLIIITIFVIGLAGIAKAQVVFVNPQNQEIYDFIDELANERVIDVNSAIKPYSRKQIYNWLIEAKNSDELNKRQKSEIEFYLKDYQLEKPAKINPYGKSKLNIINKWSDNTAMQLDQLSLTYRDKNFSLKIKPIWGVDFKTNSSGSIRHFWGGAKAEANIGNNWGIYASLRDNSMTEITAFPSYFTLEEGGNYKIGEGGRPGGDYSEMRGGITYQWNWGDIAFIKDQIQWGDNYHGSNILSGRTPSYAMIKLHIKPVKWFDFNYHHGWLVSEVVDSANSYYTAPNRYRTKFREKYIAANMYTFTPIDDISLSVGNSIVYSDLGGPHPAYLIPFMFFKSIDHTLNHRIENQNSQMFLNLSVRRIKHLHLFGSMFIDEFKKERFGNDTLHNFVSSKAGFRLSNWPIENIYIGAEYTLTNPMTYEHRVEATTFATNKFNLGHYLVDNSREIYFMLGAKPLPRLHLKMEYFIAEHGNDLDYSYTANYSLVSVPIVEELSWSNKTFSINAQYELLNDVFVKAYFQISDIRGYDRDGKTAEAYLEKFTPVFYHGKQNTFGVSFNIGL